MPPKPPIAGAFPAFGGTLRPTPDPDWKVRAINKSTCDSQWRQRLLLSPSLPCHCEESRHRVAGRRGNLMDQTIRDVGFYCPAAAGLQNLTYLTNQSVRSEDLTPPAPLVAATSNYSNRNFNFPLLWAERQASTTIGLNCVPEKRFISSMALSSDIPFR